MHFPKIYLNIFQILDEEEGERERGDEEEEEREMGVKNEELEEVDAVPSRSVSVACAVKRFIASLTSQASHKSLLNRSITSISRVLGSIRRLWGLMMIPHLLKRRSTMFEVGDIWSMDRYGFFFFRRLQLSAAASSSVSSRKLGSRRSSPSASSSSSSSIRKQDTFLFSPTVKLKSLPWIFAIFCHSIDSFGQIISNKTTNYKFQKN